MNSTECKAFLLQHLQRDLTCQDYRYQGRPRNQFRDLIFLPDAADLKLAAFSSHIPSYTSAECAQWR